MLDAYIEIFFTIAAVANSLLFLPQITRLLKEKNAKGVSLITFLGFNVINLAYLLHGIIRIDKPLMLGAGLSTLANTTVTLQIIYYRYLKK